MVSVVLKNKSNMQVGAFYYVLITTYFMAGSPAESLHTVESLQPMQPNLVQQKPQQPNSEYTNGHPRERTKDPTRDFLYDPVLHSPSSDSILVSNDAQDLAHLDFRPSLLSFGKLAVGDVNSEVVTVFNRHPNRSVYLGSISGSSADFYSSFFENKVCDVFRNIYFNIFVNP